MRSCQLVGLVLCASFSLIGLAVAQEPFSYTDSLSGIQFSAQAVPEARTKGGLQFGVALPPKLDKNEYIGHIIGSRPNGAGWTGISHSGAMRNALLLVTWADGNEIKTSFRYATGYMPPREYTGNAKLTPLSHSVNATHFTLTYHCQGCFSWSYNGVQGNQSLTKDAILFGWAQGAARPSKPSDPQSAIQYHSNGYGVISANSRAAANPSYDSYLAGGSKQPSPPSSPAPSVNSTIPGVSPSTPSVGSSPSPAPPQISPLPSTSLPQVSPKPSPSLPQISPQPSPSLPLGAPKIPVPTSTASTPISTLATQLPKPPLSTSYPSGFPKGGPVGYGGPKGFPKGPPKGIPKGAPKGFPKGGPPWGFPSWDDDDD